jgi:YjbE family integral membrane protein
LTELLTPEFWAGLMAIIGVNIVLSGDNAVVIALAARSLPPAQQKRAIAIGSGAAVVMRIVLTIIAVEMLRWPYLKIIGSLLLLWIAIQLMQPEDEEHGDGASTTSVSLGAAIRTILIADLVMSLDNVLAVAAAAKGSIVLLIAGLAISIPLVIFGSTLLLKLMERFPIIITLGAALLGWVAGDMATTDPAVKDWVAASAPWLHELAEVAGAALVVLLGNMLAYREMARRATAREAARPAATPQVRVEGGPLFHKLLVAVDSSDPAARAVEYVLTLRKQHATPDALDICIINVQRDLPGDVSRFVSKGSVDDYRRERGAEELARARALLDAAGAKYDVHVGVGNPGEVISAHARETGCDHIIMGTRGLGSYTGALLGSIAQSVAATSPVPVVLVK